MRKNKYYTHFGFKHKQQKQKCRSEQLAGELLF